MRTLSLRSIVSAPIRSTERYRSALILDSRRQPDLPTRSLQKLVEACAFLLGSLLDSSRGSQGSPTEPAAHELVGDSEVFRKMLRDVDRYAPAELPVLIEGESGSGKEGVARRLHAKSRRRSEPFVAVNCAAFTETLLDAELFGSVRGAYTGADRDRPGLFRQAQHGTLFLDEVGEMSPQMQAKLLRVLEERSVRPVGGSFQLPVDVRVLAATHHDLRRWKDQQLFREDLFYRLAVLDIRVPPLRERLGDLPLLVTALTSRLVRETGLGPPQLTKAAWSRLNRYTWPGNIRELHSVLARAMLQSNGSPITGHRLQLTAVSSTIRGRPAQSTERLEHRMIHEALHSSGGNLTEAAEQIGWTRQKLYRRMHALSIRC